MSACMRVQVGVHFLGSALEEGTDGFKVFNLEKDRSRSLSPAPGG